jgi:hypothetical protein
VARPAGLRSRRAKTGVELWRVETTHPSKWTWTGFAQPRYRFDPASGRFRTRYAATQLVGAFRERYRPTGLVIPSDHIDHHLVRLVASRPLRVLDLRTEKNLDALQVDDQISTGQHAAVWATCHRLADASRAWWSDLDAIVYRSRTTPESSVNYALFSSEAFTIHSWRLGRRSDILAELVLRQDFTIGWDLPRA